MIEYHDHKVVSLLTKIRYFAHLGLSLPKSPVWDGPPIQNLESIPMKLLWAKSEVLKQTEYLDWSVAGRKSNIVLY